jgi:hypothetical protein
MSQENIIIKKDLQSQTFTELSPNIDVEALGFPETQHYSLLFSTLYEGEGCHCFAVARPH